MSPRRRLLVLAALLVVLLVVVGAVVLVARAGSTRGAPAARPSGTPAQDEPGPVLLVPGYGGSTQDLQVLASALRATGREATVVPLPGDGRGPLAAQADVLDTYVQRALAGGADSVDLVGYSAGGVVVRLWDQQHDGADKARRIVTLGAPHHGAELAGLGALIGASVCPAACQELVPGSGLLTSLRTPVSRPPQWLALWSTQDQVVQPPDSGRLEGAVTTSVQALCPALQVSHAELPTDPVVTRIVLSALGSAPLRAPTAAACSAGG